MGGFGSGKPKKIAAKRTSGTGYKKGEIGYNNLKYKIKTPYKDTYEIDTNIIRKKVDEYITNTPKPNRIGLRIALDISRETYLCYLQGYINRHDIDDEAVNCNYALSDAMRAGDDAILEHLVTNDDKYGQTKYIRLLEAYGELTPQKQVVDVNANINLGKLSKYSK